MDISVAFFVLVGNFFKLCEQVSLLELLYLVWDFLGRRTARRTKIYSVVDGQNGYIIQNTFVALHVGSFDELYSYIAADWFKIMNNIGLLFINQYR